MLTLNRKPNKREITSKFVTNNTDHFQRLLMVFIAVEGIETLDELYKYLNIDDKERKVRDVGVDYHGRFRTILDGMFVKGMKLKPVAEELGISIERVRQNSMRFHRILYTKLRRSLGVYKKLSGPISQFLNEEGVSYIQLISLIQNEIYNYPEKFSEDFILRNGLYYDLDKYEAGKLINILRLIDNKEPITLSLKKYNGGSY
jgi:hypothetical protein